MRVLRELGRVSSSEKDNLIDRGVLFFIFFLFFSFDDNLGDGGDLYIKSRTLFVTVERLKIKRTNR